MPDARRRTAPPLALHRAVFDARFPEGRAFGEEIGRLGVSAQGFDGDITAFWWSELSRLWPADPRPVAGLTGHGALFCLERWAWDAGLRVLLRAEHRPYAGGVEHRLTGSPALLSLDRGWPREMARLVADLARPRAAGEQRLSSPGTPFGAPDEDLLVSWVIGPADRSPADAAAPLYRT
jgi:hypothetical protein